MNDKRVGKTGVIVPRELVEEYRKVEAELSKQLEQRELEATDKTKEDNQNGN